MTGPLASSSTINSHYPSLHGMASHANSLIRFNTARMNTFYAHIGLDWIGVLLGNNPGTGIENIGLVSSAGLATHWLQLHFHLLTIPSSSVSSVGISISVSSFLVISLAINQSSVETFSFFSWKAKNFQLHKICINIQHPSTYTVAVCVRHVTYTLCS